MILEVNIETKLEGFTLTQNFTSTSRRLGILGSSGCGKSMTLKSIAGIETPDSGRIVLDGNVLFDSSQKINIQARNRKIGYLFQSYALFPNMTVEQNIAIGIQQENRRYKNEIVEKYLEKFALQELKKRYPNELSGGQQQRVALARIMANEPAVILLDEPFSALDEQLKTQMKQEMEQYLKDFKGKLLIVSHSKDEIYQFSDELLVMKDGKGIAFGQTKELFYNPGSVDAARLMGCENISRIKRISETCVEAVDWGIRIEVTEDNDFIRSAEYVGIYGQNITMKRAEDVGEEELCFKPVHCEFRERAFSYLVYATLKEHSKPVKFKIPKSEITKMNKESAIILKKVSLVFMN